MKDLIVITKKYGFYTGATVATQHYVDNWSKYFDRIYVFTLENESINEYKNITVIECGNEKKLLKDVLKLKKSTNEVVGYSDDHLGYLFEAVGIPYIHTYHGNWPDARYVSSDMFFKSFYFIHYYKKTISSAAVTVDVSYYMHQKFTKKYAKHSVVIRNGTNQISSIKCSNKINPRILMIGNIDKRKYKIAKKIFKLIKNSELIKSFTIDIYGEVYDKKLSNELNSYDFVNIKGKVSKIDISDYNILLSLSAMENLPISIVEAAQAKIPIISTNVGGVSEVVHDSLNGYILDSNNYNEIIKLIDKATKMDVLNDMALSEEFNWEKSSLKYIKVFDSI